MTKGEIAFREFCEANSISIRRISEANEHQTPDYELTIDDAKVVSEVKDIEMNDEEKDVQRKMKIGQLQVWGSSRLGSRVRDDIGKANRQLKNLSYGKLPSILVLFDTRPIPFNMLYPYEIKVAMYGFETLDLSVSKDFSPPVVIGRRFGPGKKFTPSQNTSTSAVAILEHKNGDVGYQLIIYHNRFASVPLFPSLFRRIASVKQLAIKENIADDFGEWEPT